ncbi:MAG: hypothetical protein U1D55_14465 [Phycisphaerae bacterium]
MRPTRLRQAIREFAHAQPDARAALLPQRLAAWPACPVTHYLLGCQQLDRGRVAHGVRHMMMAHRFEPQFESAALLVFSGLEWIGRRGENLLPVLLATWEEFRRPEFDRRPLERFLLDAFAEPDANLTAAPALARRIWRLPIATLRYQIREALEQRDAARFPLLLAPT